MNIPPAAPNDSRMARLTETIEEGRVAVTEFRSVMRLVNDNVLQTEVTPVIEAAELAFKQHAEQPSPTIANDAANLLAAFNQLNLPSKDVDFGPLPGLKALRSARGNIREEFSQILLAARALGWRPSEPALPDIGSTEIPRDGLEGMLKTLIARMDAVEQVLDRAVEPEGESAPGRTTIQIALVSVFVRNLRVELALAKLEARVKSIVDLSALGRAIENVTELTADFIATVRGIAAKMTTTLREASEQLRPRVWKITGGFKSIVKRIALTYTRAKRAADFRAPPDLPTELPAPWSASDINSDLDTAKFEQTVETLRASLQNFDREREPFEWATTQNNLGNMLSALGERESGTARLDEAVEAYRAALQEFTRERAPHEWAATQNNLGDALRSLGERESDLIRLEEAIGAFRAALQERTRERAPLQWAATQNNLGNALRAIGEREGGTVRLGQAVEAYRTALQERIRERVPLEWATTQNNLGNALSILGAREIGTVQLGEAVESYRAALQELPRERMPLEWAKIQNNLGNALRTLGERENSTSRLEQAVAAYYAALQERTREHVPLQWAATQNNLAVALERLGERKIDPIFLEEAVGACRAALQERTRELVPLDWAATQNNLGNALLALGKREKGLAQLEAAVEAYRAALQEYTSERVPYLHDLTMQNLAASIRMLELRKKEAGP